MDFFKSLLNKKGIEDLRKYSENQTGFSQDLIEKGEKQATLTIGVLVSVAVVILTVFLRMLFAGKRPVASAKPTSETKSTETASETDATAETSAEREENEKEDASATCPRSSRRET
ncbi:uncharacterized protein A4U43_C02F15440 [Asparagus officinalis]|uniref:Uncharacterized protein n=1 Tax=Asparagus officinalis TaxID=4686 RepID=A0A5P1FIP8_ASPOF|nr:uncharacterized protein A4U43_C02F15440 [Asparagus officinalis]